MRRLRIAALTAMSAGLMMIVPAHAVGPSGSGSTSCADGTVTWSPSTLWPPNHKMHTISITYVAPADVPGDTTTITVGMIVDDQANSSGADEIQGSGQPTDQQGLDWSGSGNSATSAEGSAATTTADVRSERSGLVQAGRHYTITVMCTESTAAGTPMPNDSGSAMLQVTVPHDQGH